MAEDIAKEDKEDKEDDKDNENDEDKENKNGVENQRNVKVESSDNDDAYDDWNVWKISHDYESRIKELERENEELKGQVELLHTNLAEAGTIILNLKGYVQNIKDI